MNEEEFSQYIASGHEQRSIEFKGTGPKTKKPLLVQVVKAAMGLANTRDGGIIIIGVDEDNNGKPVLNGLSPEDLATWSFDSLSDSFAEYADPTISFDIEIVAYKSNNYVVIHINEFLDTPIICKKTYPDVLRAGSCYVRPRRKPETTEPPSHADMLDLLSLATEKGIRRFMSQATSAGLDLSTSLLATDRSKYDRQINELIDPDTSSKTVKKIVTRGYWMIRIYPIKFEQCRITDISSLLPIIQRVTVRKRGWDFPHIDPRIQIQIGLNYIGQESEWEHMLSSWRFYQSGQFIYYSCIPLDWRDQSSFWPPTGDWKPGQLLGIGDTIATFSDIYELASRLATTDAGDEKIHLSILLGNLKDRALLVDDMNRWPLDYVRRASIMEYPIELELNRTDLIANIKTMPLEQAMELFKRFNFETTTEILRSWQEKMDR